MSTEYDPDVRIKETQRRYRERNREKIRQYHREYYQKHREEILEYNRRYFEKHPEMRTYERLKRIKQEVRGV